MLRRLTVVTLITLSLLAGSFFLAEQALTPVSPTLVADGWPTPPPPLPPPIPDPHPRWA